MNDHFNKFLQTVTIKQASTLLTICLWLIWWHSIYLSIFYNRFCSILYIIACWYQNWRTLNSNSHALDQVPQTPETRSWSLENIWGASEHKLHWTAVTTLITTHITVSVSPYLRPASAAVSWSCGVTCPRSGASGGCRQLAEITRIQSQ